MILISEDQYKLGKFNPCLIKGFFTLMVNHERKSIIKVYMKKGDFLKKK